MSHLLLQPCLQWTTRFHRSGTYTTPYILIVSLETVGFRAPRSNIELSCRYGPGFPTTIFRFVLSRSSDSDRYIFVLAGACDSLDSLRSVSHRPPPPSVKSAISPDPLIFTKNRLLFEGVSGSRYSDFTVAFDTRSVYDAESIAALARV